MNKNRLERWSLFLAALAIGTLIGPILIEVSKGPILIGSVVVSFLVVAIACAGLAERIDA